MGGIVGAILGFIMMIGIYLFIINTEIDTVEDTPRSSAEVVCVSGKAFVVVLKPKKYAKGMGVELQGSVSQNPQHQDACAKAGL